MLITLLQLKEFLGIAESNNEFDATLNKSIRLANSLIAGYIGFDVSDINTPQVYTTTREEGHCFLQLPFYPVVEVMSITVNNEPVVADWWLDYSHGTIEGLPPMYATGDRRGLRTIAVYRAGFAAIPADLREVALSIAAGIYGSGGTITSAATGGSGELKSLTMFDAMSMSFDVGAAAANPVTPENMVAEWGFILKKYRVNAPVLA